MRTSSFKERSVCLCSHLGNLSCSWEFAKYFNIHDLFSFSLQYYEARWSSLVLRTYSLSASARSRTSVSRFQVPFYLHFAPPPLDVRSERYAREPPVAWLLWQQHSHGVKRAQKMPVTSDGISPLFWGSELRLWTKGHLGSIPNSATPSGLGQITFTLQTSVF